MQQKLPNILWIFSDQHRSQALSCYGNENIKTPNLDRLANEGIQFENAYANTPLCSPFRASLYTGKYITSHGVISLFVPPYEEQRMLAEEIRDIGYYTSHMGKWHLSGGDCPCHFVSPFFRPGWDEWLGWENSNRPWDTEYSTGPHPHPIKKLQGYQTDALTDLTIKWLRNQEKKPWFHVLSLEPPHPPNEAPQEFMERFKEKKLDLNPNVPEDHEDFEEWKELLRGYYAQISNLDYNIGRILNTLEKTGEIDNTIIFYFSDHGDMMGSHGRRHKSRPETESSKIPLLIRYPKLISSGKKSDALISGVDIMPTLLGMIGADIPNYVEGKDFSPVIYDEKDYLKDSILLQFERNFYGNFEPDAYRTIITKNWMYTNFLVSGPGQLFNLTKDPYQLNNLIDNSDYKNIKDNLHDILRKKLNKINDNFMKRSKYNKIHPR